MFDLSLFPVSSPDFIARHSLDGPSKLASAPLIEQRDSYWDVWFDHTGFEASVSSGSPACDDEDLALDEDGNLKAAQLEKSSGHSALDDLWLKALEAVSSLPAPPSMVLESQIVLQLEFVRADQVA